MSAGRAMTAGLVLAAVHLAALSAGFLAPYPPTDQNRALPYAPPTRLHFVDDGGRVPPASFRLPVERGGWSPG